jgi:hypothetical protein
MFSAGGASFFLRFLPMQILLNNPLRRPAHHPRIG